MKYRNKVLAVLLVAVFAAVPLVACSQKTAPASAAGAASGGQGNASSQTRIVGKVTSVIGNQVVLAVGTMKNAGGFGGRSENSGSSGGRNGASGGTGSAPSPSGETASGASAAGGQSGGGGFSSADLSLTGETQTLLIPVGLTLTSGGTTSRKSGGSAGGQMGSQSGGGSAGGSGGRSFGGGSAGGAAGGAGGSFGGASGGGTSRSGSGGASGSRSGGAAGGASGGTAGSTLATLQRSQDFSSIKKGMILQVVEETLSDGTQGITQVRIISQ